MDHYQLRLLLEEGYYFEALELPSDSSAKQIMIRLTEYQSKYSLFDPDLNRLLAMAEITLMEQREYYHYVCGIRGNIYSNVKAKYGPIFFSLFMGSGQKHKNEVHIWNLINNELKRVPDPTQLWVIDQKVDAVNRKVNEYIDSFASDLNSVAIEISPENIAMGKISVEKHPKNCDLCYGDKKLECKKCKGQGSIQDWLVVKESANNRQLQEKLRKDGIPIDPILNFFYTGQGEYYYIVVPKTRKKECPECNGSGYIPCPRERSFWHFIKCSLCRKTGKVKCENCLGFGSISVVTESKIPICFWVSKMEEECSECNGIGYIRCPSITWYEMEIPKNVKTGWILEGHQSTYGNSVPVYFEVGIQTEPCKTNPEHQMDS